MVRASTTAPPRNRILAFGVLLACLVPCGLLTGDDDHQPLQKERLLLLKSGRTVRGVVTRNGDQYTVRRPTGEMYLPADKVRFECRDLHDAYRMLQAELPQDNLTAAHFELARWCLQVQLLNEARNELKAALAIDPAYDDARELLRKIDEVLDPPLETPAEKRTSDDVSKAMVLVRSGIDAPESLGGLSKEAAMQFMRRIQPMLMNNCTAAGCHGPDDRHELRLARVVVGESRHRAAAEQNLGRLLTYVNVEQPRQSPLLEVLDGTHGRRGRVAFAGARGKAQADEFKAWVLSVARQQHDETSSLSKKRTSARPLARVADRSAAPALSPPSAEPVEPDDVAPVTDDPFDPAAFNAGQDRD